MPATQPETAAATPPFWRDPRRVARPLLVLGVMVYAAYCGLLITRSSFVLTDGQRWYSLFDDAMITMRYAWNLAHGLGPVWNAGERVEGYTNPLMLIFMTLASCCGDKRLAVLLVQILGVITLLLIAWLTARLSAMLMPSGPLSTTVQPQASNAPAMQLLGWLPAVAALLYYPLIYWSLVGMETGLLTAALLAALLAAWRTVERPGFAAPLTLSLAAAAAYFARPDGIALCLPALVLAALGMARRRSAAVESLLALGPLALLVGVHALWRKAYYGAWLPNTYVLKVAGIPLSDRLENGLIYLGLRAGAEQPTSYLRESWPALLLALLAAGALLALAGRLAHSGVAQPRARVASLVATVLLAASYQVSVGGDPWNYWRILTPIFPLLMVLIGGAAVAVLMAVGRRPAHPGGARPAGLASAGWLAAGLLALAVGFADARFWREWTLRDPPYTTETNRDNAQTALALRRALRPEARIALLYAGTVAYYTDFRTIDMLGKSDPRIARVAPDLSGAVAWEGLKSVPGHNKYDLSYSIVELQPDYVDKLAWGRQNVADRGLYYSVLVEDRSLFLRIGSPHIDGCALGAAPAEQLTDPAGQAVNDRSIVLAAGAARTRRNLEPAPADASAPRADTPLRAADPAQPSAADFALLTPAAGYYAISLRYRAPACFPLRMQADALQLVACDAVPAAAERPRLHQMGVFFLKKGAIRLALEAARDFPELHAVVVTPIAWTPASKRAR